MEILKSFEAFLGKNMYGGKYISTSTDDTTLINKNTSTDKLSDVDIDNFKTLNRDIIDNFHKTVNLIALIKSNDINGIKSLYFKSPEIFRTVLADNGDNIIIDVCKYGNLDILKFLVEEVKLDINKKLYDGRVAIGELVYIYNLEQKHIEMLKYLLSRPDIELNIPSNAGNTPLLLAIDITRRLDDNKLNNNVYLHLETIKLLLEAGADPYYKNMNISNYGKKSDDKFDELFAQNQKKIGYNAFEYAAKQDNFHNNFYSDKILEILNKYKKQ